MRRLSTSLIVTTLLISFLPSTTMAATTSPSRVVDELENTRNEIRNIYEDDIPATADEIDEFADDIETALDEAISELEDLITGTYITDDMSIRYWADLVRLETLIAMDELRIYSASYDAGAYDDAIDQIWDILNDFMDLVDERTVALDRQTCFIEAIATPKDQFIATQNLLDEIADELHEVSLDADDATYEAEINRVQERMDYSGYYAYSELITLFRISNSNLILIEDKVNDIQEEIDNIRYNVADAVGNGSNRDDDLANSAYLLVARLDDTLDELRQDITREMVFDSGWDGNRTSHLNVLKDVMDDMVYDIADRTDDEAVFATSTNDHVKLRQLNYVQYLIASQLIKAYRIPLFEDESDDLGSAFEDVEDALKDFLNELDDSLAGGNNDLMNETENIFDELDIDPEDYLGFIDPHKSYSDMPGVSQTDFRNAFMALSAYGVVNGNNGRLLPEWQVTRFEFIKMMFDSTCVSPGVFYDRKVSKKRLSAYPTDLRSQMVDAYMAKAVDMGVISGNTGRLNPDQPITRFEAAKMIKNIYSIPDMLPFSGGIYSRYADVGSPSEPRELELIYDIAAGFTLMVKYPIFNPPSESVRYFRPNDYLTRGEAAKITWMAFMQRGLYRVANEYPTADGINNFGPHPGGHIYHNNLYNGY